LHIVLRKNKLNIYFFFKSLQNKIKFLINFRLLVILINTGFIYITPQFKNANNEFNYQFYIAYFIVNTLSTSISFILNLTLGCFFAQISDKKIGGKLRLNPNFLSLISDYKIPIFRWYHNLFLKN
jgi:hypothetical protein